MRLFAPARRACLAARSRLRAGFTLLHLIIVIVILAVLAGVLIPAAETLRRAGSRMSCQNNLKQLGFAIHNYRDTHGNFPPGTIPNPELPPHERLSYFVALLPYCDCEAMHKLFAVTEAWDSPKNIRVSADWGNYQAYPYQCPEWMGQYGHASGAHAATGHLCITNYIGVAGVGTDAATRQADAPGIGMFGYDRTLKADQVKDGLANTMMLIETGHEVGPWLRGGPGTVRAIDPDAGPLVGDGLPFGGTHFREKAFFRGTVAAGFCLLLADGSVRYVKGELAPEVLAALATVAGGEEVPTGW